MNRLATILRAILSRDAIHTYVAGGSLYGLWYGLAEIHRPTAMIVISVIFLAAVVYARVSQAWIMQTSTESVSRVDPQ